MTSEQFKRWRNHLGLKQQEAAERLGISRESVSFYERGERDGKPVSIPRDIELACAALAIGLRSYNGPEVALSSQERFFERKREYSDRRDELEWEAAHSKRHWKEKVAEGRRLFPDEWSEPNIIAGSVEWLERGPKGLDLVPKFRSRIFESDPLEYDCRIAPFAKSQMSSGRTWEAFAAAIVFPLASNAFTFLSLFSGDLADLERDNKGTLVEEGEDISRAQPK
jgi:transcriptional regulator with XRE-family HTH domain